MSSQTTTTMVSTKLGLVLAKPIDIPTGRYVCPHQRSYGEKPSSSTESGWRSASTTPPFSSASNWRRGSDSTESDPPSISTSPATIECSPPNSSPPTRAFRSTNWRVPASNVNADSGKVLHLRPGQIQRLPTESEIDPDSMFRKRQMLRKDNPWEHPVVILDVYSNDTVRCRLLGTMGGKKLWNKTERERLKIALCENDEGINAHAGTRILTVEAGSEKFGKATYCNFFDQEPGDGSFVIERSNLRTWKTRSGNPIVLSQESVRRIKAKQVF